MTTNTPIHWALAGAADSGPGSLRDVIAKANATKVAGVVEFGDAPLTITLESDLPNITTNLTLDGRQQVVISGGHVVANGLTFAAASAGSTLRGVSLEGFRDFGVRLLNATGVLVDDIRVTGSNTRSSMGLYATGDLTGTRIVSSTFSGGLRGALLAGTRNLVFGEIGRGNLLTGNRPAPGSRFAGTGIRAEGDCRGTRVEGNTFSRNNYGFAFIAARNLLLIRNHFVRNQTAAIFLQGNCAGSIRARNTFGAGNRTQSTAVRRSASTDV